MQTRSALAAGAIGATSLTIIHESARKFLPNSPRVELMGMRAIQKYALDPIDKNVSQRNLYLISIFGDLVSNGIGYALAVGLGHSNKSAVLKRSAAYGLGVGALTWVFFPLIKVGQQPTRDKRVTSALTMTWYLLGGIATAVAFNLLKDDHAV